MDNATIREACGAVWKPGVAEEDLLAGGPARGGVAVTCAKELQSPSVLPLMANSQLSFCRMCGKTVTQEPRQLVPNAHA